MFNVLSILVFDNKRVGFRVKKGTKLYDISADDFDLANLDFRCFTVDESMDESRIYMEDNRVFCILYKEIWNL